jgi:hypothetical protein
MFLNVLQSVKGSKLVTINLLRCKILYNVKDLQFGILAFVLTPNVEDPF